MKFFYSVITALLLCFTLISCQSDNTQFKELNSVERETLVDFIRYNVAKRLTVEQQQILNESIPIVKFNYESNKEGKVYVSWTIPQDLSAMQKLSENPNVIVPMTTINVSGYGVLDSPKRIIWNISVIEQTRVTTGD